MGVKERDLRVEAYFRDNKDKIKPPKIRLPDMEGAIRLSLDKGNILFVRYIMTSSAGKRNR